MIAWWSDRGWSIVLQENILILPYYTSANYSYYGALSIMDVCVSLIQTVVSTTMGPDNGLFLVSCRNVQYPAQKQWRLGSVLFRRNDVRPLPFTVLSHIHHHCTVVPFRSVQFEVPFCALPMAPPKRAGKHYDSNNTIRGVKFFEDTKSPVVLLEHLPSLAAVACLSAVYPSPPSLRRLSLYRCCWLPYFS